MPHAALWVVQQNYGESPIMNIVGFNAARGFVGGAAFICSKYVCSSRVSMPHAALWVVQLDTVWAEAYERGRFNAARGFVGGAALRH